MREEFVVHRQTDGVGKTVILIALLLCKVTASPAEGYKEGHVDVDGVAVAKRNYWGKLQRRRQGMAKGDHAVETDLVKVWRLKLGERRVSTGGKRKTMRYRRRA